MRAWGYAQRRSGPGPGPGPGTAAQERMAWLGGLLAASLARSGGARRGWEGGGKA